VLGGPAWEQNLKLTVSHRYSPKSGENDRESIRVELTVYDHLMNISNKFGSNLFRGFRKKDENVKFP